MRRLLLACCLLAVPLAPTAAARAADAPTIHAHRGGALSLGVPDSYEDTLEAFTRRIEQTPDAWLEMDALVSADGVPYVLHDSTVDRTTDCTGAVVDLTSAQLDTCRVDQLGVLADVPGSFIPAPAGGPVVRLPRLADVLALARERGASVNLEIKRIPGDPGYVPGDTAFARRIMDVVRAAHLDPAKLIIQSFDPSNLEVARRALPGVQLSFLSLGGSNAGLGVSIAGRYAWWSPGGVPSAADVQAAHAAGVRVVPYTLDTADGVRAAAAAGVDALITNDVLLARRALGLPEPDAPEPGPESTPPPTTTPAPIPVASAPMVPTAPSTAPSTETATSRTVVAAPAPPASAATRPARLDVRSGRRAAVLRSRRIVVAVRGKVGTTATVIARRGKTVVARGTVVVGASGARRGSLRLTAAGTRSLRQAGGRRRVLSLRVTLDGRTSTRRITLR